MQPSDASDAKPADLNVMDEVGKILEVPLDVENFANLQKQLAQSEAWLGRVAFRHRNDARFLAEAKRQMLIPVQRGIVTDMDRQIKLEADVRDAQATVDILGDYFEILAKRLSLGQSIMAGQRQEMKSQLK